MLLSSLSWELFHFHPTTFLKWLVFTWINSLIQPSCASLLARQCGGEWKLLERNGSIQIVSGCQDCVLLLPSKRKLQMSYKTMLSELNIQASVDFYSLATCLKKNPKKTTVQTFWALIQIVQTTCPCMFAVLSAECVLAARISRNNIWDRRGFLWKRDFIIFF